MNKKKSLYNITFGIASQLLSIALGIIIPRLFLLSFGSEMNGFLNTVTQIFAYFVLLEAGVGAASLQALYGPVGKEEKDSICSIMAATNHYYRKTGVFYFVSVVGLAVIYPFVVQSNISKLTMMAIILMNGIPGVISYFYQGKYVILLQAEGKNYVSIILNSISNTLISIMKIVLLINGFNIIAIQATYLVINLIRIIIMGLYVKRNYPWLDLHVKANIDAISQKNAAFVGQICDLIFRNTDTIILAIFCDLKYVSVYAMYTLLFSMVRTALDYVAQGFTFIMGQTYNRDINQFTRYHDLYETYRMSFTFALYNIAFIFMLPFIKLYTAGVTDIEYLDFKLLVLFIIFYLLTSARVCESDLINYAQHFKLTQSRCITEAVINLGVSIVAVNLWGIYGVLLGTIVALLYRTNDMFWYADRRILHRMPWRTYKRVLTNSLLFVVISLICSRFTWNLNSYLHIIMWASISGICIIAVYLLVASFVNYDSYLILKGKLGPVIKRKLPFKR